MRRSIAHLPEFHQHELNEIIKVLADFYPVEMIILFGSFARTNPHESFPSPCSSIFEKHNHYDLLLVFKREFRKNRLNQKIRHTIKKRANVATPQNVMQHGIHYLNEEISNGNLFFNCIRKEGIRIYHTKKYSIRRPTSLNRKQNINNTKIQFNNFYQKGLDFLETYKFDFNRGKFTKSSFELHQTVENFYNAIISTYTHYRPETHDLDILRQQAQRCSSEFEPIFKGTDETERRRFNLLRRAYIDSRYQMNFNINREDLEYLYERVDLLRELVMRIGAERIKYLANY